MRALTPIQIIFLLASILLLVDSQRLIASRAYWPLFTNLIFILIAMYMIAIYPTRKLKLNQDLILILIVFFVGAFVRSWFTQNLFMGGLNLLMGLGFGLYLVRTKQSPYRLNMHVEKFKTRKGKDDESD